MCQETTGSRQTTQTAATAGKFPQKFNCLACTGELDLAQLGGGTLKCPHCNGYLLESIQAATTAAVQAASTAGDPLEMSDLTTDLDMDTDGSKETLKGFTAAEMRDPFPAFYGSVVNPGGVGAAGSSGDSQPLSQVPWPKSGSIPDTQTAFAPKPSSPPRGKEHRAEASPY